MDILGRLFGGNRRRGGGNDFFDTLRGASRWIIGCGCALVLAVALLIILIVGGTIKLGEEALTVGIVIAMIVVAVVSLIRSAYS